MNQDYFDKVYEKTYRPLLRYAIVHLNDPLDAEDALQNVFVDFYRRIEACGHADILAPQLFLLKMLKREIIRNYAERSAHETSPLEENVAADPLSFEDAVETRVMAGQVMDAAKALSPDTYRVFVLYYGFELSVAEIAKEMHLGTEAVKSRLHRGRNAVRRLLAKSNDH
jgi:RNA polymerase sigma-70 factor (ECF subfamily)